jgi:hypothetical protein
MLFPTAQKTIDQPVLIDMLTGKVYQMPALIEQPGWWGNNFADGLPMTDYPLVVTDLKAL